MDRQVALKIGVDIDRSKLRDIGPELRRAFASVQEILKDFDPAKRPGLGGVLKAVAGKGDPQAARSDLGDVRKFFRDHYQNIKVADRDEFRRSQRDLEKQRDAKLDAIGFSKLTVNDRARVRDYYRDLARTKLDAFRVHQDELSREQMSVRSSLESIGGAIPKGSGGRGVGRGALRGAAQFGFGLTRGIIGGGLLFGGAGFAGYLLARKGMEATERQLSRYDILRRIGDAGTADMDASNAAMRGDMLTPTEAVRAANTFSSLAGRAGGGQDETLRMGRRAAQAGLGFGVGTEAGAQVFGQMARLGVGADEKGQKRFAGLLAEAIAAGRMRGREGEFFHSMEEFAQAAMRTMLRPPAMEDVLGLQQRFAEASGFAPGAKGAMGAATLGQAHTAMAGTRLFPGMPNLMRPFMLAALSRSGERDISKMQEIAEQGMFGRLGTGETMFDALVRQFNPESGGPRLLMFAEAMGLPVSRARNLARMARQHGTTLGAVTGQLPKDLQNTLAEHPELSGKTAAHFERFFETGGTDLKGLTEGLRKALAEQDDIAKLQAERAKIEENLDKTFQNLIPVIEKFTTVLLKFTELFDPEKSVLNSKWNPFKALNDKILPPQGGNPLGAIPEKAGDAIRNLPGKAADAVKGVPGSLSDRIRDGVQKRIDNIKRLFRGRTSKLPDHEKMKIAEAAELADVDPEFLARIRVAENGGPGREFGVLSVKAPKYEDQARVAAESVKANMERYRKSTGRDAFALGVPTPEFVEFMGRRYAPPGAANDPEGLNRNWVRNVLGAAPNDPKTIEVVWAGTLNISGLEGGTRQVQLDGVAKVPDAPTRSERADAP